MTDASDTDAIVDFYGRWADLYDRVATAPGIGRWRRRAAEQVADPGDVVVEMGCGSGANLPYLADRVGQSGSVVGVDITPPLLARARERTADRENVAVVAGDATRPPFCGRWDAAGDPPDAVLATFVTGLFADPAAVVDDWCDLVGPGGRIALLNASASERLAGRPFNPLFAMFTAAGAPNTSAGDVLRAPWDDVGGRLTRKVTAARTAMFDRTEDRVYETFALGFVGLAAGTVE